MAYGEVTGSTTSGVVCLVERYYLPGACYFDWTEFSIIVPEEKAHQAGHARCTLTDPEPKP